MKICVKRIVFDSYFEKSFEKYKKKLSKKQLAQLKEKFIIFKENPFDSRIKTHKLKGNLKEYWSFSISNKDRILFRFQDKETAFLIDVGNHNIYK